MTNEPPSPGWAPPPPPPRRTNAAITALVVALVVALGAGALGWYAWHNERENTRELRTAVATSNAPDGSTAPPTTGEPQGTNPFDALGSLGSLFGGDTAQLAQCLGDDIGSLLGGRLSLPDNSAQAQYDAIVQWVQQDRELTLKTVPKPVFVDAAEMARRVRAQILRDYSPEEAKQDQDLFESLGVIEPGTNLRDEYAKFVGGQVAGYYDTDTGAMVILGNADQPLDGAELTTVAHELEHALADQQLGIPKAAEASTALGADAQLAATALVEGDATLTMTEFQLEALDLSSLLSLGGGDIAGQLDSLNDAPHYLASQLLFPYTEGLGFVCGLRNDGGWPTVDRAYDKPPTTTAQVMFPDRYTDGEAAKPPPAPASPGAGWRKDRTETFGAADLMFLFEAPGNDTSAALSNPRERAAAWAGGTVTQWTRGTAVTVNIDVVERAGTDGPSLCDSMGEWLEATTAPRAGGSTSSARGVQCNGDVVQVSIANG
jgi:hypothetical protein